MSDWHPIKTAPKDGTPFLAYRHDHYGRFGNMQVTYWRQAEDEAGYIGLGEFNEAWMPTHWMPLPAAPRGAA
ncbi:MULTISPECIES: DUF551 domain-containing protein [Aurantimonas]|uniref:DUF551 domain-containing protein n=1 Tax=Aurantimonas TaxID=182269 RepID=UPI003515EB1D